MEPGSRNLVENCEFEKAVENLAFEVHYYFDFMKNWNDFSYWDYMFERMDSFGS